MYWIGLLLVFLLMAGLACSIGGEEEPTSTPIPPTATPVPPTATPEPPAEEVDTASQPADMVSAESQARGVRLSHPEDWFYTDAGFIILLSTAADADTFVETEELPDGVTMFVMAGPAGRGIRRRRRRGTGGLPCRDHNQRRPRPIDGVPSG
jgi:hypothetical protein